MLELLRIDLKKLIHYRTFWVIGGLYFLTLGFGAASGMEFLRVISNVFTNFGEKLNIDRIPLYHFPDVWLNLIWCAGLLKIVLAIVVVISVTNEFTYRTIRQNIIDGFSREQFLLSKIFTNILLCLVSVLMIFIIGLITGLIYSPVIKLDYILTDLEFFFAYFLELLFFTSYALLISILLQRAGLSIIILLLSKMIELIITSNLTGALEPLIPFFPMQSIANLIEWPFPRYAFQEIKDYLDFSTILIVACWTAVFNGVSYWRLKTMDL
jgi:ABC-2 type transport system permease protein